MSFSDALQDRLAPWLTPATDPFGDHAKFLTAVAAMGAALWDLVMDQGDDPDDPSWVPGFGALFDVDLVPLQYAPFLGQLVGVPPSALLGADDATARSIIRSEAGQQRGTPAAVIAAAQRFLSGTKSCILVERTAADGSENAYWFLLIIRPEELFQGPRWDQETDPWLATAGTWTGSDQTPFLQAAVNATKPAGVMWTLVESDGFLWSAALHTWSADTMTFDQTASQQP